MSYNSNQIKEIKKADDNGFVWFYDKRYPNYYLANTYNESTVGHRWPWENTTIAMARHIKSSYKPFKINHTYMGKDSKGGFNAEAHYQIFKILSFK